MKQYDFVSDIDENGKENVSVAYAPKRRKIDVVPMIICFFIALLIWIYMINLNDTGMTATMTIPVTIEGVDELREKFWDLSDDLTNCITLALSRSLKFVESKGGEVYYLTVQAANYYKNLFKKGE